MMNDIRRFVWLENGIGCFLFIKDVVGLKCLMDVEGLNVFWCGLWFGLF